MWWLQLLKNLLFLPEKKKPTFGQVELSQFLLLSVLPPWDIKAEGWGREREEACFMQQPGR